MCTPNCTDTISRGGLANTRGARVLLADRLGVAVALLREWLSRRRYRSYLASMDDRDVRDIGLCRNDVEREANRPFWVGPALDESARGRARRG